MRLPVDEATADAVSRAFQLQGFFPEFSAELCTKLFARSGVYQFRKGEKIVSQGERGRDLFLILAGEVSIVFQLDEMSAEAARVGPGVVLGEGALLKDGLRSATIVASQPVFVFRLTFEDLGYVLENNPQLGEHLKALARERAE